MNYIEKSTQRGKDMLLPAQWLTNYKFDTRTKSIDTVKGTVCIAVP